MSSTRNQLIFRRNHRVSVLFDMINSNAPSLHSASAVYRYLDEFVDHTKAQGFIAEDLSDGHPGEFPLLVVHRKAQGGDTPTIYLSTGIHGDEPAGPLALLNLLRENNLPRDWGFLIFPLINPEGMVAGTRENGAKIDMNRDFRNPESWEIKFITRYLEAFEACFDLSIILHEDWESKGYYLYERIRDKTPSLANICLKAAESELPIDYSNEIDGWKAENGIALPSFDPDNRKDWPETIYLLCRRFTKVAYNLESPSSVALERRIIAHSKAVSAALREYGEYFLNRS